MKRIVLIDGDIDLFQITQQCQVEIEWDENTISRSTDLEQAKKMLDNRIEEAISKTDADTYIFCLTGDSNFRKVHFPTYKSNRKETLKPIGYRKLKEYAMDKFKHKIIDCLEADDVMGIYSTRGIEGTEYVIYSADKDMKTIPTLIYDMSKGKVEPVSELEAIRFLYTQVLTGDRVDGYTGLPTCGKVKAQKAMIGLKTEEEIRDKVFSLYLKYYKEEHLAKEHMLSQCRQARILRASDWDFEKQEVKLWDPWS